VTHFAIFEEARDGRIWSRFADIDGIVGNGATIDEARESLLVSTRLAAEAGEVFSDDSTVAVERLELGIPA